MQSAYIHFISDHDQRYNICIVWTRQMESDDKTVESQREKNYHTCIDRRLHWSNDRYDSIFSIRQEKWYFRLGIPFDFWAFRCRWYFVFMI